MAKELVRHLKDEYSKLNKKSRNRFTALKYQYEYKKDKTSSSCDSVGVSLYFDAYHRCIPNLIMVLKFPEQYYVTSLNVHKIQNSKQYLLHMNGLASQISGDNGLSDFFAKMTEKILTTKPKSINYKDDKDFNNAIKKSKRSSRHGIFFFALRKSKMSNKMYDSLKKTTAISLSIIDAIRKAGFTVVRTNEPTKKKDIISTLKSHGIL